MSSMFEDSQKGLFTFFREQLQYQEKKGIFNSILKQQRQKKQINKYKNQGQEKIKPKQSLNTQTKSLSPQKLAIASKKFKSITTMTKNISLQEQQLIKTKKKQRSYIERQNKSQIRRPGHYLQNKNFPLFKQNDQLQISFDSSISKGGSVQFLRQEPQQLQNHPSSFSQYIVQAKTQRFQNLSKMLKNFHRDRQITLPRLKKQDNSPRYMLKKYKKQKIEFALKSQNKDDIKRIRQDIKVQQILKKPERINTIQTIKKMNKISQDFYPV